jgi:hypothetical protein
MVASVELLMEIVDRVNDANDRAMTNEDIREIEDKVALLPGRLRDASGAFAINIRDISPLDIMSRIVNAGLPELMAQLDATGRFTAFQLTGRPGLTSSIDISRMVEFAANDMDGAVSRTATSLREYADQAARSFPHAKPWNVDIAKYRYIFDGLDLFINSGQLDDRLFTFILNDTTGAGVDEPIMLEVPHKTIAAAGRNYSVPLGFTLMTLGAPPVFTVGTAAGTAVATAQNAVHILFKTSEISAVAVMNQAFMTVIPRSNPLLLRTYNEMSGYLNSYAALTWNNFLASYLPGAALSAIGLMRISDYTGTLENARRFFKIYKLFALRILLRNVATSLALR